MEIIEESQELKKRIIKLDAQRYLYNATNGVRIITSRKQSKIRKNDKFKRRSQYNIRYIKQK